MPELDVGEYAKTLYSRVGAAVILKRATIGGGDWEPQPNMCHHNVSIWCQHMPEYKAVRGWLYFDLPGLNYVKFVAHSAVRTPDGELFDITPSSATQDYPFIESGLSEEKYAEFVETRGFSEIHSSKENA